MAIIIKIEKRELPDGAMTYREICQSPGFNCIISAGCLHTEIPMGIPAQISTEEKLYFKMLYTGGSEIFIEEKNREIFTQMVENAEYYLRPKVHSLLVKQLEIRESRESFGEKWFSILCNNKSLGRLIKLWWKLRNGLDNHYLEE